MSRQVYREIESINGAEAGYEIVSGSSAVTERPGGTIGRPRRAPNDIVSRGNVVKNTGIGLGQAIEVRIDVALAGSSFDAVEFLILID